MDNSFIKLYRRIEDSGFLQDPPLLTVWIHLLIHAEWRARKIKVGSQFIDLKPGQVAASSRTIAEATGLGRQVVRRCLRDLGPEGTHSITHQATHQASIITICKWGNYQGGNGAANPPSNPQSNPEPTHRQPTPNPPNARSNDIYTSYQEGEEGEEENIGASAPCPYSKLQKEWNRLAKDSGLRSCRVFGDGLKRNAKARWAADWFREHWQAIFSEAHRQEWCRENHAGIDHVLRRKNAERYVNAILDRQEKQAAYQQERAQTRKHLEKQREKLRQQEASGEKRKSVGGMKSLGDVIGGSQ